MPSRTISRANLPIPDPQHVGLTTFDAKDPDTSYPPIEPVRPPAGAPNVLVVLALPCPACDSGPSGYSCVARRPAAPDR